MDILEYKGVSYSFEGIISNISYALGEEIIFFDRSSVYVCKVLVNGSIETSKVHQAFIEALWVELELQYDFDVDSLVIDLDSLIDEVGVKLGCTFGLLITEYTNEVGKKTNMYYNLYIKYNSNLYPVTLMQTGRRNTELYFGSTLMLKIATDIERFPSLVSFNVIQRQIDLLTKERTIGKKILDLNKVLVKGLHVTKSWEFD